MAGERSVPCLKSIMRAQEGWPLSDLRLRARIILVRKRLGADSAGTRECAAGEFTKKLVIGLGETAQVPE